jgi:hydrogenase-4 component E
VLGAITIGFKAVVVPLGIGIVLRNLEVPARVPSVIGIPSAFLFGIALSSFSFLALSRLDIGAVPQALPLSALAVAFAVVLVSFLLMAVRPYAPSQVLGFLVLENGATLAGLVVAPGLPLILALLLLFDVFVGVLVFVVLVQYLGVQRTSVTTDVLDRLRG